MPAVPVKVEAFISGAWVDITAYTLSRDGLEITRGRPDETATVESSACRFTLNNRDGRFSPRNPTGPYFGLIGRNTPVRVLVTETADSAPRFDADSFFTGTATGDMSWIHTPIGDVRGILVFVVQDVGITDEVITITYGGVVMSEVPGSPLISSAGAEDGVVYCFHLGSGIPQGLQTVLVDVNATASVKDAWAISVTAGSTTTVVEDTTTLDSAGVVDPSVTLTTTVKTFLAAALHSGQDATPSIAATSPAVALAVSTDFGSATAKVFYRADAPTGSPTIGATATSEEAGLLGVALKNGPDIVRFSGEITAWPQRWDETGRDVWVPVEAAGVMRRLGQGAKALRSALTRYVPLQPTVKAYWPMEDMGSSRTFAAGLSGGRPMLVSTAGISFASQDGPPGSDTLPTWQQNGSAYGSPPTTPAPWRVDWVFNAPAPGAAGIEMVAIFTTSDTAYRWFMVCSPTLLWIELENDDGTSVHTSATVAIPANFYGNWWRCFISVRQSGGSVAYIGGVTGMDGVAAASWSATIAGTKSAGKPQRVGLFVASTAERSIGHVTVGTDDTSATLDPFDTAYHGFTGETAADRFTRLCGEEGVVATIVGTAADTAAMGPQRPGKLLELLQQCADADQGILYEPRDSLGLAFRTRASLYNQPATLALRYTDLVFGSAPEPVDDDQLTRNDVTVTREGGSSYRATLDTGPLSTQDPPDGVGRYDEQITANVESDNDLKQIAGWRLHLGPVVDQAQRMRLAIHEAGHAVAAVLLGVDIAYTELPGAGGGHGATLTKSMDPWTDAVVAMAGWAAEGGMYGSPRWDTLQAQRLVGVDGMRRAALTARDLLRDHPAAMVAVRDALLEHGRLTGSQVADLVSGGR